MTPSKLFLPLTAGLLLPLLSASAQTSIDFESPYTAGAFSTETPVNSAATAVGFTSQQGWSRSTSTNGGQILTTTSSGTYVGGQALASGTDGQTYIGAKVLTGLSGGFTTYTFNLRVGAAGSDTYVGGYADTNADNLFTQTEAQIMGGAVSNSTSSAINFGFRGAGFSATRALSGVTPTFGNWYSLTVGLNFATLTATLNVFDLTNNVVVDLNGAAAGTQYSVVATAADFGANPTTYRGVVGRTSNLGVVDNIAVPEPSVCALLAATGLGAVALRRRRK